MTGDCKFTIERGHFQSLLDRIGTVVPTKDSMPILHNFKIDASVDRIRLTATDLELSILVTTNRVAVDRTGSVLLPARKLAEILREAPAAPVAVECLFGAASVSVGRTAWSIKLVDGTNYPRLPEIADVQLHRVNRVSFLRALISVFAVMPTDNSRPNLLMVNMTRTQMIACDGARFQQAVGDYPVAMQIPKQAVIDLIKLLKMSELEEIELGTTEYHLVFRIGNDVFIANKLLVEFPDVQQSILAPALKNQSLLAVGRNELIAAIRQVRINANPKTSSIDMILTFDKLTIRAADDKFGNACTAELDAAWVSGDKILTVNYKYLSEMLAMMPNPQCEFFIGDDAKSYKAPLMLKDSQHGVIGVLQQMRSDVLLSALIMR